MSEAKLLRNALNKAFGKEGEKGIKVVLGARSQGKINAFKKMLNDAIDNGEEIIVIKGADVIRFNKGV